MQYAFFCIKLVQNMIILPKGGTWCMQREIVRFQDKDSVLVRSKLIELQNIDPWLYEIIEYVLKINGIYKDVFLYICEHPFKTREINYKLMQFLGTGANLEWFQLITRVISNYKMERTALPYCIECIHQAFLSGLKVSETENLLANSKNLPELSKNFKMLLSHTGEGADTAVLPLENQEQQPLYKAASKESLAETGMFLKEKKTDYKGYMKIPTKIYYSEFEQEDFLMIKGGADIFDIVDKIIKKVRRSISAYQRRIDTLNKIMISKENQLRKISESNGE